MAVENKKHVTDTILEDIVFIVARLLNIGGKILDMAGEFSNEFQKGFPSAYSSYPNCFNIKKDMINKTISQRTNSFQYFSSFNIP